MNAKPTLAVIGAGQIGCRHMQSLVSAGLAQNVWMVDPFPDAKQLIEARLAEAGVQDTGDVQFSTDMDNLPDIVDVAVIATSSLVRRAVLDELLATRTVRYAILEKFLFPRAADYAHAETRLAEAGVAAFVNCTRRLFEGYRALKDELDWPVRLSVSGNNWGLACNSVHWLDLLNFLKPATSYEIRSDLTGPCSAKRLGYVEFFGTIEVADVAGNRLELSCQDGGAVSVDCVIEDAGGRLWEISEQRGQVSEGGSTASFSVPFQSQLTAGVARDLLEEGSCRLARYNESAHLHQVLLGEFLRVYNEAKGLQGNDLCPIT
jgi:hypothetical protein